VAAQPSIKVVKSTLWRTGARLWSNRYHFDGGLPADTAAWTTLSDAIVADEAACLQSPTTITHTYGYAAGSDVPIFDKAYTTAGLVVRAAQINSPLQTAALIRYTTTQRTSKNHPIYLFTYIHNVLLAGNSTPDVLDTTHKTAIEEYADDWLAGFSDGTLNHVRCGPNGAVAQSRLVETYVTHRDFPT
jgi:hypothetical protein